METDRVRSAILAIVASAVIACWASRGIAATPRPHPAPNPVLPTAKFIPKTESPRFSVASSPDDLLVWAIRSAPAQSTFTYYWIVSPGKLRQLQYDLQVDQTAGDDHVSLILSRNGRECRTYHARFSDDEQQLWVRTTNIAEERPQGFGVMDNDELVWPVRGLQQDAAMDAAWYREIKKHHYKPSEPSISARDPRFTPAC